jgi:hypothetical protein
MANVDKFLDAAINGDLPRVQKMLADGDALITDADEYGQTALLCAAGFSDALLTMKWLLEEGGARITERNHRGYTALHQAALSGDFTACKWLLEHGGADIAEANYRGITIWEILAKEFSRRPAAEVTTLLRVLVVRGDPPADLFARLRPEHARVVEEGARLRAALPAYLVRRRAILDAHCPLIAPLLALVRGYDPEPTTTEELWATGLCLAP